MDWKFCSGCQCDKRSDGCVLEAWQAWVEWVCERQGQWASGKYLAVIRECQYDRQAGGRVLQD